MLQALACTILITSKKLQYQRYLLSNPRRAKGRLSAKRVMEDQGRCNETWAEIFKII